MKCKKIKNQLNRLNLLLNKKNKFLNFTLIKKNPKVTSEIKKLK